METRYKCTDEKRRWMSGGDTGPCRRLDELNRGRRSREGLGVGGKKPGAASGGSPRSEEAANPLTSSMHFATPRWMAETLLPGSSRNLHTIRVAMFFGSKSLYLRGTGRGRSRV